MRAMAITIEELTRAREVAGKLLEELALEAYVFSVEPRNEHWELRVECAIDGAWETRVIPVDKSVLMLCMEDSKVRLELLNTLAEYLDACKQQKQ